MNLFVAAYLLVLLPQSTQPKAEVKIERPSSNMVLIGCLQSPTPGKFVLADAKDISTAGTRGDGGSSAVGTSGAASSGGDRQTYLLVLASDVSDAKEHLGHTMQVAGTTARDEAFADGRGTLVDTLKPSPDAFKKITVKSLKMVSASCEQ